MGQTIVVVHGWRSRGTAWLLSSRYRVFIRILGQQRFHRFCVCFKRFASRRVFLLINRRLVPHWRDAVGGKVYRWRFAKSFGHQSFRVIVSGG